MTKYFKDSGRTIKEHCYKECCDGYIERLCANCNRGELSYHVAAKLIDGKIVKYDKLQCITRSIHKVGYDV